MDVKVLKDCSYSADGFTIIKLAKGETVELPKDIEDKFLDRGLVYVPTATPDLFTPVEETAVIEPVKEKKRRRKKKAE